ncbi:MAG: DUF6520 family protein [Verrucomicrobiales bacterium]|nr:DUF6520 family protein [Verrucomicrobiales bacterium]
MKKITLPLIAFIFASTIAFAGTVSAEEASKTVNEKCPIKGKDVNPKCTYDFEDQTYAFCCGDCRTKFTDDLAESLYSQIGGKAAIDAAVDLFYTKVMSDKRVNHFFENVNMKRQHSKQKSFISAALGSPVPYKGKDMRAAHANMDVTEADFNVIAGHLQATLEELKVKPDLIEKVMAVIATTKDAVLGTKKS